MPIHAPGVITLKIAHAQVVHMYMLAGLNRLGSETDNLPIPFHCLSDV
ncbi:hypothetical protein BN1086_04752 [Citrobacter koseri]|uniref:Uncharacterized protein n=1 Tax=Citrobacter koseri TaxID=545 RepID=A0A078LRL0_CITKO|nr:hypothetical protein BN1086_04752 [Citrobacter koseri]